MLFLSVKDMVITASAEAEIEIRNNLFYFKDS
jgi:hypothetical protein